MDHDFKLEEFIEELQKAPEGTIFNPWFQRDPKNDCTRKAPEIRRNHLKTYLKQRKKSAKVLFIAEAVGYQGCHLVEFL